MTENTTFKQGDRVERVRNLHATAHSVPIGTRFTVTYTGVGFDPGTNYSVGDEAPSGVYNYDLELVDERADLAEAVAKAEARYNKRSAKLVADKERVLVACQALVDYDEDHREPTFSERVAGFGVGAVVQHSETKRTYVKVTKTLWVFGEISSARVDLAKYLNDESEWTVLSEGVTE